MDKLPNHQKRKSQDQAVSDDDDGLSLSLSLTFSKPKTLHFSPPSNSHQQPSSSPQQSAPLSSPPATVAGAFFNGHSQSMARAVRARRNSQSPVLSPGKTEEITPPHNWATNRRATVHSLDELFSMGITSIYNTMQCKSCEAEESVAYDLRTGFGKMAQFIINRKPSMHDRAPPEWMNPEYPTCRKCAQPNSMKPVIAPKKRNIDWLFLLLGQTLGCCTLEQLKYFCKHTSNHRTAAKDRVLYLTYFGLCKQLDPMGPF